MRYNSGSLEYCNGSAWTALAAGSITNVYTGSDEPYLRFSSTTAAYSATNSTKDSACTTDFGSNFQAAQLPDVGIYMHGGVSTYTNFNVAGNTSNSFAPIESGSGGIYIYQYGSGTYPVACVRKDAPVIFSRTTVAYSASDSSKNSTCSTDFGANYEAGSTLDLAANIKAYLYTGAFNVRGDASYSFYSGSSNGGIWINTTSGSTYPVVCMKKASTSSSGLPQFNKQVFTSSGTFTTPTGTTTSTVYKFTAVGGGGDGNTGSSSPGGGGGAGGTAIIWKSGISPSTGITITVGGSGDASSVGSPVSVTASGGSDASSSLGGTGGAATGGDINITGGDGDGGTKYIDGSSINWYYGGTGGSSTFGGGGAGGSASSTSPTRDGKNGAAYGSGGGGNGGRNLYAGSGGTGASGIVIVEWMQ